MPPALTGTRDAGTSISRNRRAASLPDSSSWHAEVKVGPLRRGWSRTGRAGRPRRRRSFRAAGPVRREVVQEVFSEGSHPIPLRVDVVARGVGAQAAWLVPGDLLHHVALDEPILRVGEGTREAGDPGRAPARLLLESPDVALGLLGVAVDGQTDREERGREPFEKVAVLPRELDDVLVVLAHVDCGPDDHTVVTAGDAVSHLPDLRRLRFVAMMADHVGDVLRDLGGLPLRCPIRDVDPGHDRRPW